MQKLISFGADLNNFLDYKPATSRPNFLRAEYIEKLNKKEKVQIPEKIVQAADECLEILNMDQSCRKK